MNLPKKELYAGMLPLLDRGEGAMYVLEVTSLPLPYTTCTLSLALVCGVLCCDHLVGDPPL